MAAKPIKYIALTPIRHDGVDYAEGAEIELTPEQAEQLLALEAVQAPA